MRGRKKGENRAAVFEKMVRLHRDGARSDFRRGKKEDCKKKEGGQKHRLVSGGVGVWRKGEGTEFQRFNAHKQSF